MSHSSRRSKRTTTGSDNGLSPLPEPYMLGYCQLDSSGKVQWNLNRNCIIFIKENAFENVTCQYCGHLVQGEMSSRRWWWMRYMAWNFSIVLCHRIRLERVIAPCLRNISTGGFGWKMTTWRVKMRRMQISYSYAKGYYKNIFANKRQKC